MKERLQYVGSLFSTTYQEWDKHDAQTHGAALSYFTVLSLAPLLVIAVSIAGLVFGQQAAQGHLLADLKGLVGSGAGAIQTMLTHAQSPKAGIIASIISFAVLLYGASGVFTQLRKALNRIWDVQPTQTSGWLGMLHQQFFSFAMVVGIGFLLLVSLIITTVLEAIGKFAGHYLPVGAFHAGSWVFSLVVITLVFALIFRFVPEQTLPWRRLWPGSFATAVLFTVGKYLLGLYLGRASVTSAYGAAGSLVVLLIWVYYSSQLFLFGAEFTRIFACHTAGVCLNVKPPQPAPAAEREPVSHTPQRPAAQDAPEPVSVPAAGRPRFRIAALVTAWIVARAGLRWIQAPPRNRRHILSE